MSGYTTDALRNLHATTSSTRCVPLLAITDVQVVISVVVLMALHTRRKVRSALSVTRWTETPIITPVGDSKIKIMRPPPTSPPVHVVLLVRQIRDGDVELDDSAFARAVMNSAVASRLSEEVRRLETHPVPCVEAAKVGPGRDQPISSAHLNLREILVIPSMVYRCLRTLCIARVCVFLLVCIVSILRQALRSWLMAVLEDDPIAGFVAGVAILVCLQELPCDLYPAAIFSEVIWPVTRCE